MSPRRAPRRDPQARAAARLAALAKAGAFDAAAAEEAAAAETVPKLRERLGAGAPAKARKADLVKLVVAARRRRHVRRLVDNGRLVAPQEPARRPSSRLISQPPRRARELVREVHAPRLDGHDPLDGHV